MASTPTSSNVPVVLVTGFGPFRSVLINPSWEVAKVLKNYLEWTCPIHLIIEQMHVTYDDVSKRIPDHWLKYNPTLVIHIGVAVGSEEIHIERCACNVDYCHADNNGTIPESGRCIKKDAPQMLSTRLPIDDICERVQRRAQLPIRTSNDAGRFLCEFIYYQSLFIDPKRTVFIHIPDVDEQFTVEKLAETIQLIIYELLRYVDPLPNLNSEGNYLINPNVIMTKTEGNNQRLNLNLST